jgi:hypothetical protein
MTKRCRYLNQIRVTSIEVDGALIFCIIAPRASSAFFLEIDKQSGAQRACERKCDRDP